MLHNYHRTVQARKGVMAQGRNGPKANSTCHPFAGERWSAAVKESKCKTTLADTYTHLSHTEQIPSFYTIHLPQLSMDGK